MENRPKSKSSIGSYIKYMKYNIVTEPNPILRKIAKQVNSQEISSKEFKIFANHLVKMMYLYDGVGIAAPQIGISKQIFAIAKNFTDGLNNDLILINPVWEKKSKKTIWDEEGCLSVPNTYGLVKRYNNIKVQALNMDGKEINFEANNFLARIIQHETDHLNGVLFIDKAKNIRHQNNNLL